MVQDRSLFQVTVRKDPRRVTVLRFHTGIFTLRPERTLASPEAAGTSGHLSVLFPENA